jgi:hypothetical protein
VDDYGGAVGAAETQSPLVLLPFLHLGRDLISLLLQLCLFLCIICYPAHVFYATIGATMGSADTRKTFPTTSLTGGAACMHMILRPPRGPETEMVALQDGT